MNEDFIYKELERLFSIPCNYSPMDEIMWESGRCEDDCGKVSGADCWRRYFEEKNKIERGTENE